MANGVIDGINFIVRALNNLSFDIPDWVPKFGGKTFGFDIKELSNVEIPKLATGAVIRGGNPFMAILGVQPVGHTNIEALLDTIRQAVYEELTEQNFTSNVETMDIKGAIRGAIHEEVSYLIQSLVPYFGDISQNTRETADKDMSVQIGDREIARANQRGQKAMGVTLIT